MTHGYDRPLYFLPFDHRGSFKTGMFGWKGPITPEQTAQIAATKQVIYEGFKTAVAAGVHKEKAAILVDEQFGAAILRDAKAQGYTTACPAEKSGQEEFDFEYGEDFAKHIEAFQPTFSKVLVRYNPEGDQTLNSRQSVRLKRLSEYLHRDESRSQFLFELIVPPEKSQLDSVKGDKKAYDLELRPRLMAGPSSNSRRLMSSRMSGKSRDSIAAKIAKKSWLPRVGADGKKSAASFWDAVKTTKKYANG